MAGPRLNLQHPIGYKLSFCRLFNDDNCKSSYPLFSKYPQRSTWNGSIPTIVCAGIGGMGASGTANANQIYEPIGTLNNQVAILTTGSAFCYVSAGFAPTDSVAHTCFFAGDIASSNVGLFIDKFSDNNWYIGFYNAGAGDNRIVVAASGTFNKGDAFIVGCTWNSSTTTAYVKGKVLGTHATGTMPTMTGANTALSFSCRPLVSESWARDLGSHTHWTMLWDRELSVSEIAGLQGDPYCMFTDNIDNMAISSAINTAVFRRTLSRAGVRTGSRQIHIG